ncbi:MAG: nitroreductase family protein [Bacteroidales bacterium]|nr:nitroreductase family protein [Bacteroidales bacterium]MBQ5873406.1 nitroreductase family protein [Bacteroidales bacterium]MBQ5891761.1 nitroreductase family protein [Bacteroidales bacterium]
MGNFKDLLLKRQSDRKYSSKKVEEEKILSCLEAGRLSPSACNSQPWSFVVIDQEPVLQQAQKRIATMGMNRFVKQVPVLIAIVLEKPNFTASIGSVIKDKEYPLLDIGIATNNICMQATELGLGSCILGWFDEKGLKQLLDVPESKRIPLVIALGYPTTVTRNKIRKPMKEIIYFNSYKSKR